MEEKNPLLSQTLWMNLITAAFGVIAAFNSDVGAWFAANAPIIGQVVGAILMVLGLFNIGTRFKTTKALSWSAPLVEPKKKA